MNKYANMSKNKGSKGQQNSMQNSAMGNQSGMQNSQYANGGQMQSSAQIDQNIENYKKSQQKNSLQ